MALHRFFLDDQVLSRETEEVFQLSLSPEDTHHASVIRLHPGEHIAVIDADADYFECEVISFDEDILLVSLTGHGVADDDGAQVELFQCIAKNDKMEDILRHGTELGMTAVHPLLSSRTIVRIDERKVPSKLKRWRTIVKSAAMQSGRTSIPTVYEPSTLPEAIPVMDTFDLIVIFWEEQPPGIDLHDVIAQARRRVGPVRPLRIGVVIGPEGGLSEGELHTLTSSLPDSVVLSLGNLILRAETAALVGIALVRYELGYLGSPPDDERDVR